MSTDLKTAEIVNPNVPSRGMKIFTYPKIIFIWPTFVTAAICAIGMSFIHDNTSDPTKTPAQPGQTKTTEVTTTVKTDAKGNVTTSSVPKTRRFSSPQNVFGIAFIVVFFMNLLVMSMDFPRFTVIAVVLIAIALTFFLLWLNVFYDVIPAVVNIMERIFAVANSAFYALIATVILINFGIIFVSRYLDYWEVLPNEILHNHGPFSDLERFPTTNLKFDKEIPDILEFALLKSGRLILHIQNERRAIVLDNVLFINFVEDRLKQILSKTEVRLASDAEVPHT